MMPVVAAALLLCASSAARAVAFRAPPGGAACRERGVRAGRLVPQAAAFRVRARPSQPLAPSCRQRARAALLSMSADDAAGRESELLFIYGSLMSERVLTALLQRVPTTQPAILCGFHRFRIRDRPYPAIAAVPDNFQADGGGPPGGEVAGLVLCGLSAEEHALLDYFEDTEYTKQQVEVRLCRQPHAVSTAGYLPQDSQALVGSSARASAYVYAHRSDSLYGEWSIDKFLASDVLPGYIAMSGDCRDEFLAERD